MTVNRILVNAIRTPDGALVESRHRHDYVSHLDKNGFTYSVDGGMAYLKRACDNEAPAFTEASVFEGDSHQLIRGSFSWGSYGRGGNELLHFILLKDMTTEHITAILETQTQVPEYIRQVFKDEVRLWRNGLPKPPYL